MNGNMEITLGLLTLSAAITFFVRVGFRLRFPKSSGSDVWYHLYASEEIRKNRFRMPPRLSKYSLNTSFDMPPLMYSILALLPKRLREKDYVFGPLADSIQSVVIFLVSMWLSGSSHLAFLSAIGFALTPALLRADARVFFLSPRPWAELFASVSLLFAVLFYHDHNLALGFISALFGSFVLLTGRFGAQAILFLSLGIAAVLLAWEFLLLLFFGFLLAILLSKGYYLRVLRRHLEHMNFFRTTLVRRFSGTTQVTGWKDIRSALIERKNVINIFARNPIISCLAFTPLLSLLWIAVLVDFSPILSDPVLLSLFAWANVAFIIVIFISTRQLRFLGEAERYQNYAMLPICVIVPIVLDGIGATGLWALFALALLYSVILIIKNYSLAFRYFGVTKNEERLSGDLFSFLNQIPRERILCIPFNMSTEVSYKTHHKTVYWGGITLTGKFTSRDFIEVFDEFPYPKKDVARLCRKFGATLVLFSKRLMGEIPLSFYELDVFGRVFENESSEAYRMKKGND
jgi:hypothetical protein